MIKHIVIWKLLEEANGNNKATNALSIKKELEALQFEIPEIKKIEVGIDFSATETSGDILLYSEFESKEALEAYQKHPKHQAVGALIRSCVCGRMMSDYEI